MYLFIEKGLREGISYIAKRYAKVINKYINDYDSKKDRAFWETYILWSNTTESLARKMNHIVQNKSQVTKGIRWMKKKEIGQVNFKSSVNIQGSNKQEKKRIYFNLLNLQEHLPKMVYQ